METSRKLVVFERVSADGFFASENGSMDFVVHDPEVEADGAAGIPDTDTLLLGRRTYQMFESFWPRVLEGAERKNPHTGGALSDSQRAFAIGLTEMRKLVFSKELASVGWKNSELVRSFDPARITALKREAGKNIIVLGSGSIVSQLTSHGLIDEFSLVVSPVLLGKGIPLLQNVSRVSKLDLLEAKTYRSGNLRLRYALAR